MRKPFKFKKKVESGKFIPPETRKKLEDRKHDEKKDNLEDLGDDVFKIKASSGEDSVKRNVQVTTEDS